MKIPISDSLAARCERRSSGFCASIALAAQPGRHLAILQQYPVSRLTPHGEAIIAREDHGKIAAITELADQAAWPWF